MLALVSLAVVGTVGFAVLLFITPSVANAGQLAQAFDQAHGAPYPGAAAPADVTYFGHGCYGLQNASCGYFGVQPGQLSWPQAALLAGLVQAPSSDDPITYPAAGLSREQHVLGRLVAVGGISQACADGYLKLPLSQLLAHAGACRA